MDEKETKAHKKWGQDVVKRYLNAGWSLDEINQGYAVIKMPFLSKYSFLEINTIIQLDSSKKEVECYEHYYCKKERIKLDRKLFDKLKILFPCDYGMIYPIKCIENDAALKKLNRNIRIQQFTVPVNYKSIDDDLNIIYQFVEQNKRLLIQERQNVIEQITPTIEVNQYIQKYINTVLLSSFSEARVVLDKSCEFIAIQYLYSKKKPSISSMREYLESAVDYIKDDVISRMKEQLQISIENNEKIEEQYEEDEMEREL